MSKLAAAGASSTTSPALAGPRGDADRLVHRCGAAHRHAAGDQLLQLIRRLADEHRGAALDRRSRRRSRAYSSALVLAAGDEDDRRRRTPRARRSPATGIVACESLTQRTPPRSPTQLEPMRDARGTRGSPSAMAWPSTPTSVAARAAPSDVGEHVAAGERHLRRPAAAAPPPRSDPSVVRPTPRPGRGPAAPGRTTPRWPAAASVAERAAARVVVVEDDAARRRRSAPRVAPSPRGTPRPSRGGRGGPRRCSCRARRRRRDRSSAAGAPTARGPPSLRDRARSARSMSGVPMLPPSTTRHPGPPRASRPTRDEVVVLPFVPVTPSDPGAGQAQEQPDLADDLGAARLGGGSAVAEPGIGGREVAARPTGW